jgi:hypothetical protein
MIRNPALADCSERPKIDVCRPCGPCSEDAASDNAHSEDGHNRSDGNQHVAKGYPIEGQMTVACAQLTTGRMSCRDRV